MFNQVRYRLTAVSKLATPPAFKCRAFCVETKATKSGWVVRSDGLKFRYVSCWLGMSGEQAPQFAPHSTAAAHRELVPGWGAPAKLGDQVTVNYTALDNATEKIVECTYQSAYPLQFVVGDGYVTCRARGLRLRARVTALVHALMHWAPCTHRTALAGIDAAVRGMAAGGRRLVFMPPHLGYGRYSDPPNMVRASSMHAGTQHAAILDVPAYMRGLLPPSP